MDYSFRWCIRPEPTPKFSQPWPDPTLVGLASSESMRHSRKKGTGRRANVRPNRGVAPFGDEHGLTKSARTTTDCWGVHQCESIGTPREEAEMQPIMNSITRVYYPRHLVMSLDN